MRKESYNNMLIHSQATVKETKLSQVVLHLLITTFLYWIYHLVLAERNYPVWIDEVVYQDAAVNLLLEGKFYSTFWFQNGSLYSFYASSPPLYQLLLFLWLKIFGWSMLTVRALNFLLLYISVISVVIACVRLHLIANVKSFLILVILLFTSSSTSLLALNGRPDALGFLILSLAFLTLSFKSSNKIIILAILGILVPFTALQLIPYLFLIVFILVLVFSLRPYWPCFVAIIVGCLFGCFLLFLFYYCNNSWDNFARQTASFLFINGSQTFYIKLLSKINSIIRIYAPESGDRSFFILFILAIIYNVSFIVAYKKVNKNLLITVLISLVIPVSLLLAGSFHRSYSWMVFVPAAILMITEFDKLKNKFLILFFAGFFFLIIIPGIPYTTLVTIINWDGRAYERVENLVRQHVAKDEYILCDHVAYYAVRSITKNCFSHQVLSNSEKDVIKKIQSSIVRPYSKYENRFLKEVSKDFNSKPWELISKNTVEQIILFDNIKIPKEDDYYLYFYKKNMPSH